MNKDLELWSYMCVYEVQTAMKTYMINDIILGHNENVTVF